MYCNFFGLKTDPFSPISLADCDYPNACFQHCLKNLSDQVVQASGITLLVGPTGVGKSSLIKRVSEYVKSKHPDIWLKDLTSFGQFSVTAPIHAVKALESESRARSPDLNTAQNKTVFLLDHANSVSDNFLAKFLSVVSKRNAAAKPTLLILIGLPDLESRLEQPRFCPYKSELGETLRLNPFDSSETKDYILHRLNSVGYSGDLFFTEEAIRCIAEFSNGIPRRINKLCGSSLLLASLEENPIISEDAIQNAARFCFFDKTTPDNTTESPVSSPTKSLEIDTNVKKEPTEKENEALEEIVRNLNGSIPLKTTNIAHDKTLATPTRVAIPDNSNNTTIPESKSIRLDAASSQKIQSKVSRLEDTLVENPIPTTHLETRPFLKPITNFDIVVPSDSSKQARLNQIILNFSLAALFVVLSVKAIGLIPNTGILETYDQDRPTKLSDSIDKPVVHSAKMTISKNSTKLADHDARASSAVRSPQQVSNKKLKTSNQDSTAVTVITKQTGKFNKTETSTKLNAENSLAHIKTDGASLSVDNGSASGSQLDPLLDRAQLQFNKNRLSIPKGDNAFDTYQKILNIDPTNQHALRRIRFIQRIFAKKAQKAMDRKAWGAAEKALITAIRLNPNDADLVNSLADVTKNLNPIAKISEPTDNVTIELSDLDKAADLDKNVIDLHE